MSINLVIAKNHFTLNEETNKEKNPYGQNVKKGIKKKKKNKHSLILMNMN